MFPVNLSVVMIVKAVATQIVQEDALINVGILVIVQIIALILVRNPYVELFVRAVLAEEAVRYLDAVMKTLVLITVIAPVEYLHHVLLDVVITA